MNNVLKYKKRYVNKVPINTTISLHSWKLAKEKNIAWSYALEIGLRKILKDAAGEEIKDYAELERNMKSMAKQFTRTQRKLWALEDELKQKRLGEYKNE